MPISQKFQQDNSNLGESSQTAAAALAAPARGARLGADTSGGRECGAVEQDATPSNTASSKCNSEESEGVPFFQFLRSGVDSLYLSYPGQLDEGSAAELSALKSVAQLPETHRQVTAQLERSGHLFEVKDKGAKLYPFILEDNAFRIQLSRSKGKVPMAYVKLSSAYLSSVTPRDAEKHLREVVEQFGEMEGVAMVSRIDLFVDFVSSVDMESWKRDAWITRGRKIWTHADSGKFTGWSIGLGGVISARLYNKSLEIEASGKQYLKELWLDAGWDGVTPVWRLEFELKREVLTSHGLSTLHDTLRYLNGLWSYATTEWLRLAMVTPEDQTRSRWPTHPLWEYLASVDFEGEGGSLSKRFTPSRVPSDDKLFSLGFSMLINFMAKNGIRDLYEGLKAFEVAMCNYHDHKSFNLGLPFEDYVAERVSIKCREFNTMMNPVEAPDPEEVLRQQAEAYRKASDGE